MVSGGAKPGVIRVVVVDDHPLLLEGTRHCLEQEEGIEVVGVTEEGTEAIRLARSLRPDVLILDIHLRDMSGIDVAREVLASWPETSVLILTGYDGQGYARRLLQMGVKGYLPKSAYPAELVAAVQAVARGRSVFQSESPGSLFSTGQENLTPREHEVLEQLAEGRSNAEIAAILFLSQKTVEFHVAHVL